MIADKNSKKDIVKLSNSIARSNRKSKFAWEQRIFACVGAKIHNKERDEDGIYTIDLSQIFKEANIKSKKVNVRSAIERAAEELLDKKIYVNTPEGFQGYTIFTYCGYDAKKEIFDFQLNDKIEKFFLNLNGHFTIYKLFDFLKLNGIYAQRLYEVLKSYSNLQEVTINREEFHKIMDLPDYIRKDVAQLKKRVLEIASKEINQKTNMKFTWEVKSTRNNKVFDVIYFKIIESGRKSIRKIEALPEDVREYIKLKVKYEDKHGGLESHLISAHKNGTLKMNDYEQLKQRDKSNFQRKAVLALIDEGKWAIPDSYKAIEYQNKALQKMESLSLVTHDQGKVLSRIIGKDYFVKIYDENNSKFQNKNDYSDEEYYVSLLNLMLDKLAEKVL